MMKLLVDQLGSYAEALECGEALSRQAADAPLRVSLGNAELVQRYLDGINGPRAADAFNDRAVS